MHPTLFSVPAWGFSVGSFGAMMSLGFLTAYFVTRSALPRYGIDPRIAPIVLVLVVFGGLIGTKVYFATDMWIREGAPWLDSFSRSAGMTWYGGLLGGILGAWISALRCGISFLALLEAAAVALPIGQAIGRLGCFLVGDDYGIPSILPWAMAFPSGTPPTSDRVHPTQLYELCWLLAVAYFLSRRRQKSPRLFAEYLIANGLGRFWIEFLRFNPEIGLGLTEPQWIAIVLIAGGLLWWRESHRRSCFPDPGLIPP